MRFIPSSKKLGYEMSDEEIALRDGTSELFVKPESENEDDCDEDEDSYDDDDFEDEDDGEAVEADDVSKEDTEYNEMLDKLRAEYEGDDDDE